MTRLYTLCAVAVTLYGVAAGAQAQVYDNQATATFNVNLLIQAECTIGANPLNFGTTGLLASAQDAETTLNVHCTNTTPYTIGLDGGDVAGSAIDNRLMAGTTGGETHTIAYQLYQDSARSMVWGNTPTSDTLGGVGSGMAQTIPVFARVPVQDTPAPDTYQSTVTATVYF